MQRLHSVAIAVVLGCFISSEFSPQAVAWQPPADAAAVAANPAGAGGHAPSQSYLWWFIRSSGLIGLFILALSIYFVATVIKLFLEVRVDVAIPPELTRRIEDLQQRNEFQQLYNTIQEEDSYFGRVLAVGLSELPHGLSEARDAMDRVGESETVHLEKQISMLAVLGTLGPMIGLIGTLKGMISSFSVIAMSDVQLKASEVASGISEALLLTFEGVALSVPAIYFYAVFRNRVSTISVAAMVQSDRMLRQIARTARVSGPSHPMAAVANAPPPVPGAAERPRPAPRPDPMKASP